MRSVFRAKWKSDLWESRGHLYLMDMFLKEVRGNGTPIRAFLIEPLFGDGLLGIRNHFRKYRQDVVADTIVTDARYLSDVRYIADSARRRKIWSICSRS